MEIIIKIDTNVPVTDKDKFFISFLNNVYNGKKSLDEILDEDHDGDDGRETWTPPAPEEVKPKSAEDPEPPKPTPTPVPRKKRKYKDKICVDCKKVFTPNSGRAERCPECLEKHTQERIQKQHERQTERRRAARQKVLNTPEPKPVKKEPEKPKVVACRNCHKSYTPAPDDHNFYCPKCLEKLRNRPPIQPLRKTDLTVEEVMRLPVVDRYKYAYMWSYAERQRALSMKPVYPKPTAEEAEFWRRCATGDFMED